mmetsp:Transcript_101621/g.287976  ORF Transcript_101621/g.287976 Transcript_101621/m.287976 type:complete len:258 (+) Transcript_101621:139-912(+)
MLCEKSWRFMRRSWWHAFLSLAQAPAVSASSHRSSSWAAFMAAFAAAVRASASPWIRSPSACAWAMLAAMSASAAAWMAGGAFFSSKKLAIAAAAASSSARRFASRVGWVESSSWCACFMISPILSTPPCWSAFFRLVQSPSVEAMAFCISLIASLPFCSSCRTALSASASLASQFARSLFAVASVSAPTSRSRRFTASSSSSQESRLDLNCASASLMLPKSLSKFWRRSHSSMWTLRCTSFSVFWPSCSSWRILRA